MDGPKHAFPGSRLRKNQTLQSSVVMNVDLHWVTFDGRYSAGFLLKLLTNRIGAYLTRCPDFSISTTYASQSYTTSVTGLTKFCGVTDSGLDDLANILDVKSARICHKAGSDSFLTALCFS